MNSKIDKETAWYSYFIPSLGYLTVVILTLILGILLSAKPFTFNNYFFVFIAVVYIFLFRRTLYYETTTNEKSTKHFPTIILIVILVFVLITDINSGLDIKMFMGTSLALLPVFFQLYFLEINKNTKREIQLSYSNYIFFPALTSVVIPFYYGWASSTDLTNFEYLISILTLSIMLVGYNYLCMNFNSIILHIFIGIIYLLALIFTSYYSYMYSKSHLSEILQIITIAITLVLIMGIPETWWFIKNNTIFNRNHYSKQQITLYLHGIDLATSIVPFFMVLGFLYFKTNLYFILLILFSFGLFGFWFFSKIFLTDSKSGDSSSQITKFFNSDKFWSNQKLVFGITAVILVYLSLSPKNEISYTFIISPYNIDKIIYGGIAFAFGMASLFSLYGIEIEKNNNNFRILTMALSLFFLFILLILEGLGMTDYIKNNSQNYSDLFINKLATIKFSYILIFIIVFLYNTLILIKDLIFDLNSSLDSNNQNQKNHDLSQFVNVFLEVSRPLTSSIAFVFTLFIYKFLGEFSFGESLLLSLPIYFITSLGFMFNDIYDFEKDKFGQIDKALIKGTTNLTKIKVVSFLYLIILYLILFLINNISIYVISFLILVGVMIYSPLAKRFPLFKGIFTAFLSISPIFYAVFSYSINFSPVLLISFFLYIVGREIVLDVFDYKVDKEAAYNTVPVKFGINKAKILSIIIMILSLIVLLLGIKFNIQNILLLFLIILFHTFSIYFIFKQNYKYFTIFSRITMLITAFIFFRI